MNNTLSLASRLAWRYLWKKHESSMNTMLKICLTAIALGSASLLLVLAIMNGFEEATHRQLQGIHSALVMQSPYHEPLAVEKIIPIIHQEFPEIESISPRSAAYGLLYSETIEEPHFVQVRGIIPKFEDKSPLRSKLISPTGLSLQNLVHTNNVLIGQALADMQGVRLGDTLTIFFAQRNQQSSKKLALDSANMKIVGLFKTGIEEFDESVIIADQSFVEEHFASPITAIGITPRKDANEQKILDALKKRFHLHVYAWQELYPALVSALHLEKLASIIILALIIFIASMTIISVIYMHITSKRKDIAILHTLGAKPSFIRLIFFLLGFFIAGTGTLIGIGSGIIISLLLIYCFPIPLPAAYYSPYLPIKLSLGSAISIALLIMAISIAAIFFSLRSLKSINPIEILKNE